MYLIQFHDSNDVDHLSSENATTYWPQVVIKYFENRIMWIAPNNHDETTPLLTQAVGGMDDDPQRISCEFSE